MRLKILIVLLLVSAGNLVSADSLPIPQKNWVEQALQYERALGVKQDYQKAFRLYCLAAIQGDGTANYSLGWMHFNGRGRTRDLKVAMGWFRRAATMGSSHAKRMLKRFSGIKTKPDESCPIYQKGMQVSKPQVQAWVRLIAPEFSIDSELVLQVINTESEFNPNALSPKNAQGLMQLIPATAKRFGVKDAWHPVHNIAGGVAYLNWLMRHFKGNLKLVLAAYNAGESAVHRYRGIPPYRETRRYVRKIISNYQKTVHPVPTAEFAYSIHF